MLVLNIFCPDMLIKPKILTTDLANSAQPFRLAIKLLSGSYHSFALIGIIGDVKQRKVVR